MPRNSGGTYSLPAGNPVVTGTTISSTTHNNTLSDVATEITDSLSRSGEGAMLAPLELTDGTAAAPSLAFDSDTDCGLYRVGANVVGVAAGGVQAQTWAATGTSIPGTLAVTGDSALGGAATLASTLGVTGAATLSSTLTVTGVAKLNGGVSAATDATGGTRQDALVANNGDINLDGVVDPDATTGITNRLTPKNLVKAWARVTTDGASGYALTDGFNIASVADAGVAGQFTVTIANDMANGNYAAIVSANGAYLAYATGLATTGFTVTVINPTTGTSIDLDATAVTVSLMVLGAQ